VKNFLSVNFPKKHGDLATSGEGNNYPEGLLFLVFQEVIIIDIGRQEKT
jgi:hypothetical protein